MRDNTENAERSLRFNLTTGVAGYTAAYGPTGADNHPDRCSCQNEATPHKHRTEPPFSCSRCRECTAYIPAVPEVAPQPDKGRTPEGFTWVTQVQTVDAIDREVVRALDENLGWRLLHVGMGSGGQTTLTYGWRWSGQP